MSGRDVDVAYNPELPRGTVRFETEAGSVIESVGETDTEIPLGTVRIVFGPDVHPLLIHHLARREEEP